MTEVPYTVCGASSEEHGRGARLLHMQPGSSLLGWQPGSTSSRHHWASARWCAYPQELVLRFAAPVRLQQLRICSHEFKIATRIELFVGRMPAGASAPLFGTEGVEWHAALGDFSFDPNERSAHQARELRTVYLPRACEGQFLRLRLHRCHINDLNWYSQVGLYAIDVFGAGHGADMALAGRGGAALAGRAFNTMAEQQSLLPPLYGRANGEREVSTDGDYFGVGMVGALHVRKRQAVASEDYAEASRLKDQAAVLSRVGAELGELERRKREAVALQRYEVATELKQRLVALHAAHGIPQPPPQPPPQPTMQSLPAITPSARTAAPRVGEVSWARRAPSDVAVEMAAVHSAQAAAWKGELAAVRRRQHARIDAMARGIYASETRNC